MKKRICLCAIAGALALFSATSQAVVLFGPSNYSSIADSPSAFAPSNFGYYHFNDFEGNVLNTTGVTASGTNLCIAGFDCFVGNAIDSVGNGGNQALGRSLFAVGQPGITLTFSSAVLGSLPTAVGLVWTDGLGSIRFEAFDLNNVSLGILTGNHADAVFNGTLADDRFYGATNASGISRVVISNTSGGIEIDHVQYGGAQSQPPTSVPEPGTLALLGLALAGIGFARRSANRRG